MSSEYRWISLLLLVPVLYKAFVARQKLSSQVETLTKVKTKRIEKSAKDDLVLPAVGFDFRKVDPRPYRPFLTQQHVSMGIQQCPKDDWIQIDRGYLDRLAERKGTADAYPEKAIGVNEHSAPAIRELWTQVLEHILVKFPTMFQRRKNLFVNLVTGKTWNIDEVAGDGAAQLCMLSENVEEDFYFMCPDQNNTFRLQGYIACFPGGFDSPSRVGQSVAEIHQPVPGYKERIEKGTDRFFALMKGGTKIQRFNWSVQIDGKDLFRLDGNNFYPEQGHVLPDAPEAVDLKQCYLRSERQSLACLEESKAIVFCVRSYMTHLKDIRKEGNGAALADAIESMPEKLGHYKKRPFWERDVYAFLRNEGQEVS